MKQLVFIGVVMISVFMTSCEKVVGDGPMVTETRAVTNFKSLYVSVSGKVYYKIDPVYKVEVRAQQSILPVLQTNLNGEELVIKFKDGVRVKEYEDISIYISAPTVEGIYLSGSADVDLTGKVQATSLALKLSGSGNIRVQEAQLTDRLTTTISGSGNITVDNGSCVNQTLKITGSGKLDLLNVPAQQVYTDISGSGDMRVNVSQKLEAVISGSGSVFYKGTPLVSTRISGSGTVRPI